MIEKEWMNYYSFHGFFIAYSNINSFLFIVYIIYYYFEMNISFDNIIIDKIIMIAIS